MFHGNPGPQEELSSLLEYLAYSIIAWTKSVSSQVILFCIKMTKKQIPLHFNIKESWKITPYCFHGNIKHWFDVIEFFFQLLEKFKLA